MKIALALCSALIASNLYASNTPLQQLGEKLFFDSRLSEPSGQSCASCHMPSAGFADPDKELPVSRGVIPDRMGTRNSPTAAYARFIPPLHFDESEKMYLGGLFADGRANTLEDQAKGPLTNPLEMNNASNAAVIKKIIEVGYSDGFNAIFGQNSLQTPKAIDHVTSAIASFERTDSFSPFSSKYDAVLAGKAKLSKLEAEGMQLFADPQKGNCAACHPHTSENNAPVLFTDFSYDNLGVPDDKDPGLGQITNRQEDLGKFRVPTLRNIAVTAPYMHNGRLKTLRDVVDFYNTRDTRNDWGKSSYPETVNHDELGNLGLKNDEVDAIVAFLETFTDGYKVPTSNR